MASTLVILLISALALVQANTIYGSGEDYLAQRDTTSSLAQQDAFWWPYEVAHYPEAYVLMHKVDRRLERIDNDETKSKIKEYAVGLLRQCIQDGQMDQHCVGRSIGATMSFIHHQKRQENRL
ncbi:uncharacterized protein LOC108052996 [Drosophila rhopaloa]|uniref:Uncharacterized protein LOC108052996 n=1 Tax=Drosophila rhopaloa TaxID=1041015 RepID=A0A6P4FKJ8_DRORH|nr:uncharacterized protein LOC108052996 [Drosophila rhopaloa]